MHIFDVPIEDGVIQVGECEIPMFNQLSPEGSPDTMNNYTCSQFFLDEDGNRTHPDPIEMTEGTQPLSENQFSVGTDGLFTLGPSDKKREVVFTAIQAVNADKPQGKRRKQFWEL
jgi:hypothetical protein